MTARPQSSTGVRAREMNLYRRYFDLVAADRKTIEVRVQYPNLRNLAADDHIRLVCGRDDALPRAKRVTRYTSFEEMLDAEGAANVNPDSPREQQLANIRRIYGPEKEALGGRPEPLGVVRPPAAPPAGTSIRPAGRLIGPGRPASGATTPAPPRGATTQPPRTSGRARTAAATVTGPSMRPGASARRCSPAPRWPGTTSPGRRRRPYGTRPHPRQPGGMPALALPRSVQRRCA
ncbi:ASCH domain-containing protein [Nonomuraea glycinis]|uniref:ASCH domain-containing protein n=1 Tax=Nonomuraea glycinis TaxID=2047744 RepID=UPI002E164109|nr:hypothetical protein OHA68_40200 [Nonomuraea glycinis]